MLTENTPELEATEKTDLADDIRATLNEIKAKDVTATPEAEAEAEAETNPEATSAEPEKPAKAAKAETGEPEEQAPAAPKYEAPVSLTKAIKEKWATLPEDVQAEWHKRESEITALMTRHDSELRLGRAIKEITAPYEAMIRAEGGTPEGAYKDLLNTAYVLRAGSPVQKAQLIMQAIQQFGVDLSLANPQAQQSPQAIYQEQLHQIRQQLNPEVIKKQLQEEMEADKVKQDIEAFAANPDYPHFNQVRTIMGSLIKSGKAANLKDAYEQAVWADPSIRAQLLAEQQQKAAQVKKAEMDSKRKAAASVTGSASVATPIQSKNPVKMSIEESIRSAMAQIKA